MNRSLTYATIFCLGGLSLAMGPAFAQERPPAPDVAAMASDLRVSEAALAGCMGDRPEPGQRPERPDASRIAACLTDAGASVSAGAVDAMLDAHAPPPPPRQ